MHYLYDSSYYLYETIETSPAWEGSSGARRFSAQATVLRNQAIGIVLHPHHSVLNIVLHRIQNLLCIGDSHNLEFHITELDREKDIVLPGDDDTAVIDLGADFETDAVVREEDERGGVPYLQHLRVIEEQCGYF